MPTPEEMVDIIRMTAVVNTEGRNVNESFTDGREKMGFKRIVPTMQGDVRSAPPEIPDGFDMNNFQIPPPMPMIPMDGMFPNAPQYAPQGAPAGQPPQPAPVQRPVVDKRQGEFGFVDRIDNQTPIPESIKLLSDMLDTLKSIDNRMAQLNKNFKEFLEYQPKRRTKKDSPDDYGRVI